MISLFMRAASSRWVRVPELSENQADTESTEFIRSFTERKFMRFAPATWFAHLRQAGTKTTPFLSCIATFASMTVGNRIVMEDQHKIYLSENPCELGGLRVHLIGSSLP